MGVRDSWIEKREAAAAASNGNDHGTHGSQGRTEAGSNSFQWRLAKGQPPGAVANQWRKDIALPERNPRRDTDGFLPAA